MVGLVGMWSYELNSTRFSLVDLSLITLIVVGSCDFVNFTLLYIAFWLFSIRVVSILSV